MRQQDFVNEYSGAPIPLDEIAELASQITDTDLGPIAREFLDIQNNFVAALEQSGYEFG